MIGRMVFSFFGGISARILLVCTTSVATLLILTAMLTDNLWILISAGLCHSVMWGCIFTLAVKGLGEYTSKASGIFMTGVFWRCSHSPAARRVGRHFGQLAMDMEPDNGLRTHHAGLRTMGMPGPGK